MSRVRRLARLAAIVALALAFVGTAGFALAPGHELARSGSGGVLLHSAPEGSVAPGTPPAPSISVLANWQGEVFGSQNDFPLLFTVPSGLTDELYAWALGGNYSAFVPPTLPVGMAVQASIGYEGMALGNLTPGNYSTDLYYGGWVNYASITIYGIAGGTNTTFAFGSQSQENPIYHGYHSVTLSLPSSAAVYLGVEGTGGTWPVNNTSFTWIDTQVGALNGGVAAYAGRQSADVLSFNTIALTAGIVGVAIDAANPNLPPAPAEQLATFWATPDGWNTSFPLQFTVPAGLSDVVYAWAIGGNYSPYLPPTLPAGMNVTESVGWAGFAVGNLSPGSYATDLAYAGWTNYASIVVYGLELGPNASFRYGSVNEVDPVWGQTQTVNLTLPSGGDEYFGVMATGGTYKLRNATFGVTDEEAYALDGGVTGVIGRQASDSMSFTSRALTDALVGMGVYGGGLGNASVTFSETGLPSGADWTVGLGGSALLTSSNAASLQTYAGSVPYVVTGPRGYQVSGLSPAGTLNTRSGSLHETFSFVRERTLTLRLSERGLAPGAYWCFSLAGLPTCSTGRTATISGLTPGTYSYALAPGPLQTVSLESRGAGLPLSGTLGLLRSETLHLTYSIPATLLFEESGLPSGTSWSVRVGGQPFASTNSSIFALVSSGTVHVRVGKVVGYVLEGGAPRLLHPSGGTQVVLLTFAPRPAPGASPAPGVQQSGAPGLAPARSERWLP